MNPLKYAFVEASAGTGKTYTIEHLAVKLILAGIPISRILIMTFTKAAKTELSRRIHKRLRLTMQECSKEEQRLLRAALQSFHEARITTIHGFCQALLSKYAFEAGIGMSFFEGQSQKKQHENIRNYLHGFLQPEVVSTTQLEIALRSVRGQIESLVSEIGRRGDATCIEFHVICTQIDHVLSEIGPIDKEKLGQDFLILKKNYNKMGPCIGQAEQIADWTSASHAPRDKLEEFLLQDEYYWNLVRDDNINKSAAKKKEPMLLTYPLLPQLLQQRLTPLLEIAKTPSTIIDNLASGYAKYKAMFSQTSQSHDDLLYAMQKAVENPAFFERARAEFDAAIIDEFQDTDAIQWGFFEKLFMQKRPLKALYLVGDPKQSIYAFRKADLYCYLEARDKFDESERLHLSVNYRSEKGLVNALNTLFSEKGWMALPKIKSSLEIHPVEAAEKAEEDSLGALEGDGKKGNLHFFLIEEETNQFGWWPLDDIYKNQMAPYLAAEIERLQKHNLFPLSRIALLVKDRNQARDLMDELKKLGLDSVFVRSVSIAASPVFPTVLALLRAIDAPHDAYLLKKLLVSPLINAAVDDLALAPIPEFMAAVHILKEIYEESGLAACLKKCLSLSFFQETLLERLFSEGHASHYNDYLQIQELMLEELSREERSLSQLITFLEEIPHKSCDDHPELQRTLPESKHALTVMTMHSSKGLEFDVVFAVGLPLRTLRDDQDSEEKDAEKMRLLYVAMTRAKRRLYVPLFVDKRNGPIKEGTGSPMELFCGRWNLPVLDKLRSLQEQAPITWEVVQELETISAARKGSEQVALPQPQRFIPYWQSEEVVSFSSLFQKERSTAPKPAAEEKLPLGAETGNIVHLLMEDILRLGLHHPFEAGKIKELIQENVIATPFESLGEPLFDMIKAALELPIVPLQPGHPPFSLCDVPPSSLMAEMEFCYPNKREFRKGFVDLFFEHGGLYYLIDWKTNWLPEYSEKGRDDAMQQNGYRLQAALYADALSRYVKLFDIRPFSECFGGAHYLFLRGMAWESFIPDISWVTT